MKFLNLNLQQLSVILTALLLISGLSGLILPILSAHSDNKEASKKSTITCYSMVKEDSKLTREQTIDLLLIAERSPASALNALPEPYCLLEPIQIRGGEGNLTERRLYLMDFNNKAAIVVLKESSEYLASSFWQENKVEPELNQTTSVVLAKTFGLEPGKAIGPGNVTVSGGLGDITLNLNGASLLAPVEGKLIKSDDGCNLFDSQVMPGYKIRYCGLSGIDNRIFNEGQELALPNSVSMALLRRQQAGDYVFVEFSSEFIQRMIEKPSSD